MPIIIAGIFCLAVQIFCLTDWIWPAMHHPIIGYIGVVMSILLIIFGIFTKDLN